MSNKPKILIIGPGYPFRNGPAVYLAHLCNELKVDFDVSLVNYTMLYPSFLFPGKTQYEESKQVFSYPNKRMVNSLNPFSWIKTAAYINKQNPDLVVFDWWHPFFGPCHSGIIAFLKKSLRKKILYITENVISHEANKTDKALTKLALRNATCFLALSESVKNHLNSLFIKKIFRSELPIYDFYKNNEKERGINSKQKFGFKEDDIVFLFFGLIRKYKGLDLLIEAFAMLAKTNDRLKLLIVGEFYEPQEPYSELIVKHGIAQKVVIENRYVPNEEVEDFFLASDVTILPYRSATQSGVLNVAYGFHKPAIVTNVGELGHLVEQGETGIVAAIPTVESIEQAMKEFLVLHSSGKRFDIAIEKYIAEKSSFKQVNKVFAEIVQYVNGL